MDFMSIFGALAFSAAGLQILLQAICAYMAFQTANRYKDRSKCWYYISGAFGLMALRRITAMVTTQEPIKSFFVENYELIKFFDGLVLPLSISILLFIGISGVIKCTRKNITYIDLLQSDKRINIDQLKELSSKIKEKN